MPSWTVNCCCNISKSDGKNRLDGTKIDDGSDNWKLAEKWSTLLWAEVQVAVIPSKMKYTHFLGDVDGKGCLIEIGTGSAMEPEPGEELPSGRNLLHYLDDKGQMNLLYFFSSWILMLWCSVNHHRGGCSSWLWEVDQSFRLPPNSPIDLGWG